MKSGPKPNSNQTNSTNELIPVLVHPPLVEGHRVEVDGVEEAQVVEHALLLLVSDVHRQLFVDRVLITRKIISLGKCL